jgi:hypothetical protein
MQDSIIFLKKKVKGKERLKMGSIKHMAYRSLIATSIYSVKVDVQKKSTSRLSGVQQPVGRSPTEE